MPSVSPGAASNVIPLTACTVPLGVQDSTRKSSTERSGTRGLDPSTQLRVEGFAQRVADQVEAERRDDDREPRDDREEGSLLQVLRRLGQHRSPLRPARILVAETEEAQPGD